MGGTERHPGAVAKVSGVSGSLHRNWYRGWAFDAGRDVSTRSAGDPLRCVAGVRCHKTGGPSHRVDFRSKKMKSNLSTYKELVIQPTTFAEFARRHAAVFRGDSA
jgi:hypothetical protein